jgi:hypothetical protein
MRKYEFGSLLFEMFANNSDIVKLNVLPLISYPHYDKTASSAGLCCENNEISVFVRQVFTRLYFLTVFHADFLTSEIMY